MFQNSNPSSTRSPVRIVAAIGLALTMAACGSQLDPDTVASVSGTDANGGQVGTNGEPGATGAEPGVDAGADPGTDTGRQEEHTSELQSLMRNSYAVFCLKK